MAAVPALLDHSRLPSVDSARLPALYEAAKVAIVECWQMDECKDWADRAMALASYARQSLDETLFKNAIRIQDRATRRVGELLQQIDVAHGANQNITDGSDTKVLTRKDAAKGAGLSPRQQVTALRVAKVPEVDFETLVESDDPPTVTKLAELGTEHHKPLVDLQGRDPEDFKAATPFISLPKEFLAEAEGFDLERAWRGMNEEERAEARVNYINCMAWITQAWEVLDGL